jgi:hypothetical protein
MMAAALASQGGGLFYSDGRQRVRDGAFTRYAYLLGMQGHPCAVMQAQMPVFRADRANCLQSIHVVGDEFVKRGGVRFPPLEREIQSAGAVYWLWSMPEGDFGTLFVTAQLIL